MVFTFFVFLHEVQCFINCWSCLNIHSATPWKERQLPSTEDQPSTIYTLDSTRIKTQIRWNIIFAFIQVLPISYMTESPIKELMCSSFGIAGAQSSWYPKEPMLCNCTFIFCSCVKWLRVRKECIEKLWNWSYQPDSISDLGPLSISVGNIYFQTPFNLFLNFSFEILVPSS